MNSFDDDIDDLSEDELWELAVSSIPLTRAQALMALGRMAAMADNTDRALTLVDEAIDAWGQADQPREQGFAWFIRCCVLVNADRFDEGLEAIAKAGALYAEVAAPDFWQGDIAKSRAACHRGLGNTRAAHDDFLEARRLFQLSGNDHAAAHVALEAAECTKEADVVMENLTWARDVFRAEGNTEYVLVAQDQMVESISRNRRYDDALELARENLNLARFLAMPPHIAQAQCRLGLCFYLLNNDADAATAFEAAALLLHAQQNWGRLANVRQYLADCYRNLQRDDEATTLLDQIAAFHRSSGREGELGQLEFQLLRRDRLNDSDTPILADYEVHRNDLKQQITSAIERGDDLAEARARLNLAESHIANADVDGALSVLNGMFTSQLPDLYDQSRHLFVLMRTAMHQRRWEEARALGDRAITAADACQDPGMAGRAYYCLMEVAQHDRDPVAEAESRRHAIALLLEAGLVPLAKAAAFDDIPERTLAAASAVETNTCAGPDTSSDTSSDTGSGTRPDTNSDSNQGKQVSSGSSPG
jgi:tetratricopeptide (TPR) repeat protein